MPLVADAKIGLELISKALGDHRFAAPDAGLKADWFAKADAVTAAPKDGNSLPTDMQVIGAVQRTARDNTVVMCAAGTMPGEFAPAVEVETAAVLSYGIRLFLHGL